MIEPYFLDIEKSVATAFKAAEDARKMGIDPVLHVEAVIARNMAERVYGMIKAVKTDLKEEVIKRITELEQQYGAQDWRVALQIAYEVSEGKFCEVRDLREAIEIGLRVGLAYITNGVVSSPLEGFTKLAFKKRMDGKDFLALYFSGPIRSAGGTAASVAVLIGDFLRIKHGIEVFDCREEEARRYVAELYDYHERVTNLQYLPSEEEIIFITKHLPVMIDGDPSEKYDVSNYKSQQRMETDQLRNGVCLVIGEGLCQKAGKLKKQLDKWGDSFGIRWNFLDEFLKMQTGIKAKLTKSSETMQEAKVKPDFTFIKDLVAGRPVFTYPLRHGGFRLRYGRSRVSGFSCMSIHPATMIVLDGFIAVGTQLKVERPGKSAAISICDSMDGPTVKLSNGEVRYITSVDEARKVNKDVVEILYLGDILVNYGDFLNRNHVLMPAGWNEEQYVSQILKLQDGKELSEKCRRIIDMFKENRFAQISFDESLMLCKELGASLHPKWTYYWTAIDADQFRQIAEWVNLGALQDGRLVLPFVEERKRLIELLGVPHVAVGKEYIVVYGDNAKCLKTSFEWADLSNNDVLKMSNPLFKIRDRGGTFIGCRMGRPEKAKMRKLTGGIQVLFPVGKEGGRMRNLQDSLRAGKVNSSFGLFYCEKCKKESLYLKCINCDTLCKEAFFCQRCNMVKTTQCHDAKRFTELSLDIGEYYKNSLSLLGLKDYKEVIKGVRGTSNEDHIVEHLAKGILRSKYGLCVNKDGTVRYDISEMPLTHFKPKEIGTSVERLKRLGYIIDIYGKPLERDTQVLELRPQDIVLPGAIESLEKGADDVLFRVAQFIDDELKLLYKVEPFYRLKKKEELVGHLIVGIAPHISAGAIGRIIGFSRTQSFLAHPYFHSLMRRDCDGDESGILLLMDCFLNFSRTYLPEHRGARQDAPLVLSSRLQAKEVDDMVFDMDIAFEYGSEFYEACNSYEAPGKVAIPKVRDRIGTPGEFEGFGYTHETTDLNEGVLVSSYKSLPTMEDKVAGQMRLAEKIRAVDAGDVARLVIERHFMRDIRGNLRKFSHQEFRCSGCNEKYRRVPLAGRCRKCNGNLLFTVAEGGITKYLEPSLNLAKKYDVPTYLRQTLELTQKRVEAVFGKEHEKQEGLGKFFSA